jgi:hypothetical protein
LGFRSGSSQIGWRWAAVLLLLLTQFLQADASHAAGGPVPQNGTFGIDFVSAAGNPPLMSSQRYGEAMQVGSGWDRWVIYWNSVETSPGQYDWSGVDGVVVGDAEHGLNADVVLLGTPSFYATSTTASLNSQSVDAPFGGLRALASAATSPPQGLYLPTFADGTDLWTPGKAINPQNHWAAFVNQAVSRFHNQVHYWEIWNEPDFTQFWTGSLDDYVRLLKVAYLAAHAADYSAKIMVGGMMYWQWANAYGDQAWLRQFIAALATDPAAPANGYYFDVIPWHWYSRSSDVYWRTLSADNILAAAGIRGKEMWINETNAPACNEPVANYVNCNDYPGGVNPNGNWALGYATLTEQASFIIQAIAYGLAAGATHVFQFQLQDDGNGSAFGMFRNDGSVRPIYQAYGLAVQNLQGFTTVRRYMAGGAEWVTFGVPGPNPHRTTVLWNDTGQPVNATVPAAGIAPTSVGLIQQDGTQQGISPSPSYTIPLAPATDNRNFDSPWNPNDYIIGGPTVFLVENLPQDTTPPTSRASVAPGTTTQSSFQVNWSSSDPGGWGVYGFTLQYRDLSVGGYWTNWLTNTISTSGTFYPTAGHTYAFRSLAEDWAGNVEQKCAGQGDVIVGPTAVSATTVQGQYRLYFPLVGNQNAGGC